MSIHLPHTVIVRQDGIDRTYKCDNYYDAIVLFDVFSKHYNFAVELWHGKELCLSTARE